ncbi:hypothetical protein [Sphingomonas jatrophae]|uniref:Uncharacterized protein n=1 Tax=Sphingomonas jatrophae TaxID=1166337 RepID=A0A1I6LQX7_9SPHN|nr:hypothetical protein [Sphingomonas jatrophae]SFS05833.1 hypothetical protein SAMN05192580_3146 [Sphingomonas jatrophae]
MSPFRTSVRLLPLLLSLAAPALAGTRATYVGQDGGRVIVEVADNGDARVGTPGAEDYGLLVGGRFHVVGLRDGRLTVARAEDVATAIGRVVPPIFARRPSSPAQTPAQKIEPDGIADVAGRPGRRFRVSPRPAGQDRLVVSDDPALKPVGAALEGFSTAALLPMAVLLGPAAATTTRDIQAMFALGTPLETPDGLTLTAVDTVDVPAERVRLPAPPISLETLEADLRAGLIGASPR